MINLNAWFQKHGLCAENILYIYRKDRKTVIQRTDGAEFALFVPVHSVLSTLPEKNFLSISKGIVVCRSHIVNISNLRFITLGCLTILRNQAFYFLLFLLIISLSIHIHRAKLQSCPIIFIKIIYRTLNIYPI